MMRMPGHSEPGPMGRRLRRLGADAAASGDELREFMQRFRGKSPQEVLGLVAQSGLVRATCTAAVGCFLLVALFTVLPYVWARVSARAPGSARAAKAQGQGTTPAAPAEAEPGAAASTTAGATPAADGASRAADGGSRPEPRDAAGQTPPPGSEAVLNRLNIDAEPVDPDVNPLEDAADDLLDDLK